MPAYLPYPRDSFPLYVSFSQIIIIFINIFIKFRYAHAITRWKHVRMKDIFEHKVQDRKILWPGANDSSLRIQSSIRLIVSLNYSSVYKIILFLP